jgi:ESCRT-I complex subunit VPS37
MAQKPRLDALRAETAAAFQSATDLKARWAHLEVEQAQEFKVRAPVYPRATVRPRRSAQRFGPDVQLARLRHATSDQDRISEGIAADFQSGTLDDDAALARYREMRRVWHRRALTSELWTQNRVRW